MLFKLIMINFVSGVSDGKSKDINHLKKMLKGKEILRKIVQTQHNKKMNRFVQEISDISSHLKRLKR